MFWPTQNDHLHPEYTCQFQLYSAHEKMKHQYFTFIPSSRFLYIAINLPFSWLGQCIIHARSAVQTPATTKKNYFIYYFYNINQNIN